jgi:dihydroorotate dehydrogenase
VDIYQSALRPLLFSGLRADPEWLAQATLQSLRWIDSEAPIGVSHWLQAQLSAAYCSADPRLAQTLWGQTFENPIGLAAGFDKDGVAAGLWSALGFGFAELGTVTALAQSGNPKPRLFRLIADQAALNRMGFNNQGSAALADRLAARRSQLTIPIGINLGKSKLTPLEAAAADYCTSFGRLQAFGDYFVVNVSSPNTPGLRSLQAIDQLEPILAQLQAQNTEHQPLLIKIAPDLDDADILAVVALAQQYKLAGIIATNTTIRRDGLQTQTLAATGQPISAEAGGISGAPVRQRSTEVIRLIYQHTQGQLPIIGVGGVFSAADAWEKITAGASLVQVYTGWIYEGPWMVKRILAGLLAQLDQHGLAQIDQAIGLAHHRTQGVAPK